jgi:hypothetical protein
MFGLNFVGQEPPWGNNIVLTSVNIADPWANYPGGNPFPISIGNNSPFPAAGGYVTFPLDFKPMYLNQWNLSMQRQLGRDWLVTANYLGNSTLHLFTSNQANPGVFLGVGPCTIAGVTYSTCSTTANINQRRLLNLLNPSQGQYYAGTAYADDGATACYEALFLSVQKRLSGGTTLLANYTWSHCISDVIDAQIGSGGTSVAAVPGNRRRYRSNCQTSDQRHVFNLSAVVQSPKFQSRAWRTIASYWQFSPILQLKSANFFTVTSGVDTALTGQTGETPNLVAGVTPYVSEHSCSTAPCITWITSKAFTPAASGTYGNLGYNNLKGPGVFNLNVALTRTFPVRERQSLQIRGGHSTCLIT